MDVERCRRRVVRERVVPKSNEVVREEPDAAVLQRAYDHYRERPHEFEGPAARVAARVVGEKCESRWVTRASRDGRFDFVCLLHVGDPRSRTGVVVLGQAKCVSPNSSVGPEALARLVARLRRDWIGASVTTETYSDQAQEEVLADSYPLLLIN